MIVKESINFERGLDPKEAMNIGVNLYRCGRCGTYTDKSGNPIDFEKFPEEADRIYQINNEFGDTTTESVNGNCCLDDEKTGFEMKVTRDMAIDAGDPDLEGTLY